MGRKLDGRQRKLTVFWARRGGLRAPTECCGGNKVSGRQDRVRGEGGGLEASASAGCRSAGSRGSRGRRGGGGGRRAEEGREEREGAGVRGGRQARRREEPSKGGGVGGAGEGADAGMRPAPCEPSPASPSAQSGGFRFLPGAGREERGRASASAAAAAMWPPDPEPDPDPEPAGRSQPSAALPWAPCSCRRAPSSARSKAASCWRRR